MPGATDISSYPELNNVNNFCKSHLKINFPPAWNFINNIGFWYESWLGKVASFPGLVTSSKLPTLTILYFFHFALRNFRNVLFQQIMITPPCIFATQPQCFYHWVYSANSFRPSFKDIILRTKLQYCGL